MNTHLNNFQSMFSENLVEFVDILPTLVEAAGLPELKKCPVDSRKITICREGTSLLRIPEGIYIHIQRDYLRTWYVYVLVYFVKLKPPDRVPTQSVEPQSKSGSAFCKSS